MEGKSLQDEMVAQLEKLATDIRMASLDELITVWLPAVSSYIEVSSNAIEALGVKCDALEIRIRALEDGEA